MWVHQMFLTPFPSYLLPTSLSLSYDPRSVDDMLGNGFLTEGLEESFSARVASFSFWQTVDQMVSTSSSPSTLVPCVTCRLVSVSMVCTPAAWVSHHQLGSCTALAAVVPVLWMREAR